MTDPTETAATATTDRAVSTAAPAHITRMTTTGMVLPAVAHEVNNSLQVIAGMVEILGLRGQLPPEVSDKVQKIAVQATKAAGHRREAEPFPAPRARRARRPAPCASSPPPRAATASVPRSS